jgi:monoamine oxidase
LTELLPRPATDFLERHGGHVELAQRVTDLEIRDARMCALVAGHRRIAAGHAVLATPHIISRRLMSHHAPLHPLCGRLAELDNEAIATVYLQYPEPVKLPVVMTGFDDGPAQWAFDRRVCGQPGLIAVVISAREDDQSRSPARLTAQVADQLAICFPDWPAHSDSLVIREKRATFSSRVGVDCLRPGNRTPVSGLWLAGDYTDNGLPATLEGAVRSGRDCADAIAAELGSNAVPAC